MERAKVELGRTLYHEKRLSRDNSISCNSCHDTVGYGVDGEKFSLGFAGHLTGRNSPTSFNAFLHVAQFWDGRAPTVEEQAKGPILAGGEMAMPSADAVVKKLNKIDGYKALFEAAFPKKRSAHYIRQCRQGYWCIRTTVRHTRTAGPTPQGQEQCLV